VPEDVYEDLLLSALYDDFNPWDHQDEFYTAQARNLGGPVLDLGCGTGRLAVRVARENLRVVGAEPATGMIAVARSRPGAEGVEWVQTPGQRLDLDTRFRFAYMTGHAFQAVLSDEDEYALLAAVARHLEPEGRFIFETRNPLDRAWLRWAGDRAVVDTAAHGRVQESYEVGGDGITGLVSLTHNIRLLDREQELVGHSQLRFPPKDHLETLFAAAGLNLIEWHGDWDGSPLRDDSVEMIAVTARER
jgi:SAM-dependent methyltransferase